MGLAAGVLFALTARGVEHGDAAVHIARALAWGGGSDALELDVGDLWVPARAVAGGLLYEDSQGLHAVAAPGLALLGAPLLALASTLASTPWSDVAAPLFVGGGEPSSVLSAVNADPRALAFALLGPASGALAAAFLWLAADALSLSRRARGLAVLALVAGSPLLAFAGSVWTQAPACALVAFALWRCADRWVNPSARLGGLGLALAALVLVRFDHLPLAAGFVAVTYVTDRSNRRAPTRSMARLLAPLALAVVPLALAGLPGRGEGWSVAHLAAGAPGLALSPHTGALVFAPWLAVAALGARRVPRPLAWLTAGSLAGALVLYGGWFDWRGSLVYGPRFLVPLLPLGALLLGAASERVPVLAATNVVVGAIVNLPGALVAHPRLPEGEGALDLAPLHAWSALTSGADCIALSSTAPWVLTLAAALAGLALSRSSGSRASRSDDRIADSGR